MKRENNCNSKSVIQWGQQSGQQKGRKSGSMGFIKSRAHGEVYLEPRAQCVGYEDRKEVCATKEPVHIQLKGPGISISI